MFFISSAVAQTTAQPAPATQPVLIQPGVATAPAIQPVAPSVTVDTTRDFGDQMMLSLSNSLNGVWEALPKLVAFLAILIVGWIVASLVAKAIAAILRSVRFNDLADRSGFGEFVYNMGIETDAAGFIAMLAKWFIRLIALVVAFDALGLPAVSDVLKQLLLWLPNAIVAIVVLVLGGLAASGLGNLVRGATAQAGMQNSDLLSKVAQVIVWGFAIVVAVNQLGIATTLVNTIVMGLVGAIALAAGLAFGFGGREAAAELIASWRQQARDAAPKVAAAAQAAGDKVKRDAQPGMARSDMKGGEPKQDLNKARNQDI